MNASGAELSSGDSSDHVVWIGVKFAFSADMVDLERNPGEDYHLPYLMVWRWQSVIADLTEILIDNGRPVTMQCQGLRTGRNTSDAQRLLLYVRWSPSGTL